MWTFLFSLIKNYLTKFFFVRKISVTDHLFVSLFWGKNQNEPNVIKIHTPKILLRQLNLLLGIKDTGKMGLKSSINIRFSKQMLLFYLFLLIILRYVKKCAQFFYQDYFWMLQFTDRFSSLNHQAYWRKKQDDLSATLPSQISPRN